MKIISRNMDYSPGINSLPEIALKMIILNLQLSLLLMVVG
jgi:hypothetical protein